VIPFLAVKSFRFEFLWFLILISILD